MEADVERAVKILKAGGLVAYPTETFYGIGAAVEQTAALQRLSDLKDRPADSPFPLLIQRVDQLEPLVRPEVIGHPALAELCRLFWPGPLTLVLPAREGISTHLVGPTGGVAVRMSSHPLARELVERLDGVITATSANFRGQPPPTTALQIAASGLARHLDGVVDGGPTPGGAPSTLLWLDARGARILREGAVARDALQPVMAALNIELHWR